MNPHEEYHSQIMHLLDGLEDAERSRVPLVHDIWLEQRECRAGDVLCYRRALYRCLQPHTAQADWTPDVTPSLWARVMYRDGVRIIPEAIGSTQAFALDELGWWGDELYRSLMHGNVFTPPGDHPQAWKLVTE